MRKTVLITLAVTGMLAWAANPAFALAVDPDTGIDMVGGNVYALQADGGWVYMGGKFDAIRDPTNRDLCPADNLIRLNETTGLGDCNFTPTLPGAFVHGIAVMGSFVYAGGDFGLVRVSLTTGQVDPSFTPGVGNTVHTVLAAPDGSGVYIGGAFKRVGGETRSRLAFINTDSSLGSWNPSADDVVRRLRFSPAGYIVTSGHFEHVGGNFDQSIAEIDPDTGSVNTSFSPEIAEVGAMTCFDTAPTSDVVYAACGQQHNFMAAFDASSGSKIWRQGIGGNGESASLTTVNGQPTLFIGGHMGTRDPTSQPCGSTFLHGIMEVNPSNGAIDCSWDPHLYPDTHNYTGGWVQEIANGHLWLGGKFSQVDDVKHHGIARWTL